MDAALRDRLATLLEEAFPGRGGDLLAEITRWFAPDDAGWECARCGATVADRRWLAGLDVGPRSFHGGGRALAPVVTFRDGGPTPAEEPEPWEEETGWRGPGHVPMFALCASCLDRLVQEFDAAVRAQLDPAMALAEVSRALRRSGAEDADAVIALLEKRRDAAAGERRCPFCESPAAALLRLGVHRVCEACIRTTHTEARRFAALRGTSS